jgi:hypothetical protein
MPVLRYFGFVGVGLLALLLVCNALLPSVPLPSTINSNSDLPPVRIQSDRKWPERIVMDTSVQPPAPAPEAAAKLETPASSAVADVSAKARVREAFAQIAPAAPSKPQATGRAPERQAASRVAEKPADRTDRAERPTKIADASRHQARRRIARVVRPQRPMIVVAQQPHFGWFNFTW